jgi:diacylglycerol O-acyltransferase
MTRTTAYESLSFGDALFLYLEREGAPLNVAVVTTFEGKIAAEDFAAFVESKIPLVPRYRQRVVMPPFNIGLPGWEFAPDFDVRNHIREITLKRRTDAELKRVAGALLSTTLDRRRPLWDLTLVHGLKGDRTGLIIRLHHALADGISGIALLNLMLDVSPEPAKLPRRKKLQVPSRETADPIAQLLESIVNACLSTAQQVMAAQSELLTFAQRALAPPTPTGDDMPHRTNRALAGFARLLPEMAAPAERLPFNVVCRGPQQYRWAELPLAEINAVKRAFGVTVNDVVLSVVASVIRRYAELHDVDTRGRTVRIIVPVNVRHNGDETKLGNRITFVPVTLPLDARDARALVAAVATRTCALKTAGVAELVGLAGTILGTVPSPLQATLAPIASQLPLSLCNTICTNVPGPQVRLYLLGHKMLTCYPYVPIGGEMGMNCAVLTYDGTAYIGFTGDVHAIPDLQVLEKFVTESFAEIRQAAGVKRSIAKRQTRRREAPRRVQEPRRAVAAPSERTVQPAAAPPGEMAVGAVEPKTMSAAAAK